MWLDILFVQQSEKGSEGRGWHLKRHRNILRYPTPVIHESDEDGFYSMGKRGV